MFKTSKGILFAGILFLALFGCTSDYDNIHNSDEVSIKGWSLTSEDGSRAIQSGTAGQVIATRNDVLKTGEAVLVSVIGDCKSVLDRVNDPFFGLHGDSVDYNDPEVISYLEGLEANTTEVDATVRTHSVTISISKVATAERSTLFGYLKPMQVSAFAGDKIVWYNGAVFSGLVAGTLIQPETPAGQVDCVLYSHTLWGSGEYTERVRENDITFSRGQVNTVGILVGWWKWEVRWYFDTNTSACIAVTW